MNKKSYADGLETILNGSFSDYDDIEEDIKASGAYLYGLIQEELPPPQKKKIIRDWYKKACLYFENTGEEIYPLVFFVSLFCKYDKLKECQDPMYEYMDYIAEYIFRHQKTLKDQCIAKPEDLEKRNIVDLKGMNARYLNTVKGNYPNEKIDNQKNGFNKLCRELQRRLFLCRRKQQRNYLCIVVSVIMLLLTFTAGIMTGLGINGNSSAVPSKTKPESSISQKSTPQPSKNESSIAKESSEPSEVPASSITDESSEPSEVPASSITDESFEPSEVPASSITDESFEPSEVPASSITDESSEPSENPESSIPEKSTEPSDNSLYGIPLPKIPVPWGSL